MWHEPHACGTVSLLLVAGSGHLGRGMLGAGAGTVLHDGGLASPGISTRGAVSAWKMSTWGFSDH